MTYQTHKTVTALLIARFREMWKTTYRVAYENVPLVPAPPGTETWMDFAILFGGNNSGRITIDGDYAVDRHYGIVRVKVFVPIGGHTGALLDIKDYLGKTFSSQYWKAEHLYTFPTMLGQKETVNAHYMGVVDTPFHFDHLSGDVISASVTSSVTAALTNAGSPLLGL